MALSSIFLVSIISVLASLILVLRIISWSTLIRYHLAADVLLTLGLVYVFSGTVSGMIIAASAGLLFSILLSLGRVFTPKARLIQKEDVDELG